MNTSSVKDGPKRQAKAKAKKVSEAEVAHNREELFRELFPSDNGNLPLMYQLARTVWSFKLAYEKNVGFSGPQIWILFMLANKEPTVGLTQSELTRIMQVDASAITRMVRTMEDKEWIRRAPDPADNRLTRVFLTDVGRKIIEGLPERARSVEQCITAKLTPQQLDELRQTLSVIQTTAQNEYEKTGRAASAQTEELVETAATLVEV